MNTIQICPSCHSETHRLIYCTIGRRLVCAESCALTDADTFLLELMQQGKAQAMALNITAAKEDAGSSC